jgi:phosphonate transport system ATP-binding protein
MLALAETVAFADAARVPLAAPAAVSASGLCKSFEAGKPVLSSVDLEVAEREAVGIIGANGSGKSTLLRCLVGLCAADAGTVRIFGKEVGRLDRRGLRSLRANVGFIFQRHNLVGRLSALSNVVHGVQARQSGPTTWAHCLATSDTRAEAMECLGKVGLREVALQRAQHLSGGQSQRVAIARVLMQRPRLILADEPNASLDPKAGAAIMELLFGLCRSEAIGLIFVSHHMEHAVKFSDRIVGLEAGRVKFDIRSHAASVGELKTFFAA